MRSIRSLRKGESAQAAPRFRGPWQVHRALTGRRKPPVPALHALRAKLTGLYLLAQSGENPFAALSPIERAICLDITIVPLFPPLRTFKSRDKIARRVAWVCGRLDEINCELRTLLRNEEPLQ